VRHFAVKVFGTHQSSARLFQASRRSMFSDWGGSRPKPPHQLSGSASLKRRMRPTSKESWRFEQRLLVTAPRSSPTRFLFAASGRHRCRCQRFSANSGNVLDVLQINSKQRGLISTCWQSPRRYMGTVTVVKRLPFHVGWSRICWNLERSKFSKMIEVTPHKCRDGESCFGASSMGVLHLSQRAS